MGGMVWQVNGQEPRLSQGVAFQLNGMEPMLGGSRRVLVLDRVLFWDLLGENGPARRQEAFEQVMQSGQERLYAIAMVVVLAPNARYYKVGYLWKVPYSREHKLAAMSVLVQLDPGRALGGLVLALRNDDPSIQAVALSLIGRLEDEAVDDVLLTVVEDLRSPLRLRLAAVRVLSERWEEVALRWLFSGRPLLMEQAANEVAEWGEERFLRPLIAALKESLLNGGGQVQVQLALIGAIGRLGQRLGPSGSGPAVKALRELLDDPRTARVVAEQAIRALYVIGTEEALALAVVYQAARQIER